VYSFDELCSRIHPGDRGALQEATRRARAPENEGLDGHLEYRILDMGDAVRWIAAAARVAFEGPPAARRAVRVIGITQDVTERRRAEAAARRAEELLEFGDAFFELDAEWRYVRVNRAQERLSRKARSETLGRVFWDLWPATRTPASRYWREYHRCHDERVPVEFEEYYQPLDLWTSVSAYPTTTGGIAVFFRDVTERRRAEDALRESEERFRTLVDQAADAFFLVDVHGKFRDVNRRACESLGYTREELLRLAVSDVEVGTDGDGVQRERARVRAGEPVTVSGRSRRKDGSTFPTEVRLARVDVRGVPMFLASSRDVSERMEAQRRLDAERVKYQSLFENSVDAVYLAGADGTIVEANPAACRLHGLSLDEIRARGRQGLFEVDEGTVETLRRATDTGGARGELTAVHSDGRRFPVETEAFLVDRREPERLAFVIARDISERKRSEDRLRLLAAAIEQTPASVVITDAAGVIEYVNPAFELLTGYSRGEAAGQRPSVLKSGEHDAEFYATMWRTISAGSVWSGRLVNRAKDGRTFVEDAVIAPVVDRRDVIRNYVAVKRDVTNELALQESLSHAQRLESIGRLAGGVAHDFNNLLTVILSAGEALREDLAAGRPVQAADVDEIRAAGRRASDLTRQLLAFARKQVIAPAPLDVNEVVRGAEKLLRRVIGEDVTLETHLAPGLWTALCDPGQLEQLILNLAVNARDAMPGGGRLVLATRNVPDASPSGDGPREWVALEVRDTGEGLSPEARAHLFEPFFTTKPRGKGTGLGLATVHGIVHQSGGTIHVESEAGRGTAFEVRLPRHHGPARSAEGPAAPATTRGSEAVLVVEDDASVRDVTVRALRDAGYRLLVASSGAEALSLLRSTPFRPDLVVTDVVMPGMNGRELADRIRERLPAVAVLFVSGYTPETIAPQGVQSDGAFLAKPFTGSTLLAKVRATLDEHRPQPR
jgi:PAS domain S-box-containing protein